MKSLSLLWMLQEPSRVEFQSNWIVPEVGSDFVDFFQACLRLVFFSQFLCIIIHLSTFLF